MDAAIATRMKAVVPAKAGTQYSRASVAHSQELRSTGCPLSIGESEATPFFERLWA
jgi:hypothetical protein